MAPQWKDLNERAIKLMGEGNNKKAASLLTCALLRMNEKTQRVESEMDVEAHRPHDASASVTGLQKPTSIQVSKNSQMPVALMGQSIGDDAKLSDASSSVLYNRAFALPQQHEEEETTNHVSMECQSAILLYNVALAIHRHALSERQPQRSALHSCSQALLLYRHAFSELELCTPMELAGMMGLVAALYFNAAELNALQFRIQPCRALREHLHKLLQSHGPLMAVADYRFFHHYTIMAASDNFGVSPAA